MHQKEFVRRPTRDLTGSTVLIVGLGGNGQRLAEVLHPLKTRIIATDYFPNRPAPLVDHLGAPNELQELLPQADFVFLTAPLTDQTRKMFDAATLSVMKPGSVLINVARGDLVVEQAVVDALESGHLDSAGFDVTPEEPPAEGSPLWTAPRLIITPHVGGQSEKRIDRMTDLFCENIIRYRKGEPLINSVDKKLGFPPPTS